MATALMTPDRQFNRIPQDPEELWHTVRALWGFSIPLHKVCPHHDAPFAAFCAGFWPDQEIVLWKASRGLGGKSSLLAILSLTEQAVLGASVTILGGSGLQSERVHETMRQAWEHPTAPRAMLITDPTKYKTTLVNQATANALTASQKQVRGLHPERLNLDEIDEMHWDIYEAALGQPMSSPGIPSGVVASSTYHNPRGTMWRAMEEARIKGFKIYEWCYKESMHPDSGWLDPGEVEKARRRMSARKFAVEFDLQAPSDEARAIIPSSVQEMFREDLGIYEGDLDEEIIIEDFDPDGTYLTGCDWAKEQDFTIIDTIRTDVTPWRRVAWLRTGRKRWPEMIAQLDERMRQFLGVAAHDGEGIGNVIDDFVEERGEYMEAVRLRGKKRQEVFDEYIVAIENGEVESPFIQWAYDEHLDCTQHDLTKGHPPDSFIAAALAYHARTLDDEDEWW